jgi:predicted component of type VI protein secretion system
MAFIIYFYKDQEQGRLPLEGPVLVGRSPECTVAIRDILLSRLHCKIEPTTGGWAVVDIDSKNGTRIGGSVITRQTLQDGDVIRVGKSTIRFFEGAFVPGAANKSPTGQVQRPADPFEALSGTVSAFEFQPRGPVRKTDRLPTPRPGPQEPASYGGENVRGLVTELVSSSWDSIYEEAKKNDAEAPQSPLVDAVRRRRARDPHVDLALQVHPEGAAKRDEKLSPENSGPNPGVIETPPRVGRIRSLFRKLGMLFQVLAFFSVLLISA